MPTVGFSQPTHLKHGKESLKLYDVGGGARIRGLWKQYFHEVSASVFRGSFVPAPTARPARHRCTALCSWWTLQTLTVSKKLLGSWQRWPLTACWWASPCSCAWSAPLASRAAASGHARSPLPHSLANKADLPASVDEDTISTAMGVQNLTLTSHHVTKCTAAGSLLDNTLDPAISEGFDWLVRVIASDFANLQKRIDAQTKEYNEADAKRAAELKKKRLANLAARKAAAEAAEGDASGAGASAAAQQDAAHDGAASSPAGGDAAPSSSSAPKKPASGPLCFVAGCGQPAVRRAHNAQWQAVCDACGDIIGQLTVGELKRRLQGGETAEQVRAALAAEKAAGGSADAPAAPRTTEEDSRAETQTTSAASPGQASPAAEEGATAQAGDADGDGVEEPVTVLSPGKVARSEHDLTGSGRLEVDVSQDEAQGAHAAVAAEGGLPVEPGLVPGAVASPGKGPRAD